MEQATNNTENTNITEYPAVPYVAFDALQKQAQYERKSSRIVILVIVALWFMTILAFLGYILSYDTADYSAVTDSGGDANIIGGNGDINGNGKIED